MCPTAVSDTDPRARPKPFTFYPPKNNSFLIGLVKAGIKWQIRRKLRVDEIEISPDDLQRLREFKGKRCMLTPSHSGGFEPYIIMYLAKLLRDEYNFIAAMELFEQSAMNRWLMPRLGVYSIIRGAVDRPSFGMTRQLLASGKRWLVVFPEGQTVWQNSTVIPFQEGVVQLAFKALGDARDSNEPQSDLYCLPMAIKYVYVRPMDREIAESLERLEAKLSLPSPAQPLSPYQRLRRVGEAVLLANERVQKIEFAEGEEFNTRIENLKQHVLCELEGQLGVKPSPKHDLLDRIRALFNAVDRIVHTEPAGSDYERELAAERNQAMRRHYDDLWRLLQFVSISDGYVRESMTFERFLDVLCLLEMEVFRERRIWGPRRARIKVGSPVNLADHYGAYEANKRQVTRDVTIRLETSVRSMLDSLGEECLLVDNPLG